MEILPVIRVVSQPLHKAAYDSNSFQVFESVYPEVSGMSDLDFETKINQEIRDSVYSFIGRIRALHDNQKLNQRHTEKMWVHVGFELLCNTENFISVVLKKKEGECDTCNTKTSLSVFNYNLKQKMKVPLQHLIADGKKIAEINAQIRKFVKQKFGDRSKEYKAALAMTPERLQRQFFGMKKDSLVILTTGVLPNHSEAEDFTIPVLRISQVWN